MLTRGQILKGVGGFYTILLQDGDEIVAKARGKFRKDGLSPVSGDYCLIEHQEIGDDAIVEILPRKNILTRPVAANIDQLVIVLSASAPKPDLLLLDKLLLNAYCYSIEPLIVLNKADTANSSEQNEYIDEYGGFYEFILVSAKTGAGLDELKDKLSGKVSCFAGQSAVGKSSILNALLPGLSQTVGSLSKKSDRGKHTTRTAELFKYNGGAVLDTPGFSLLDFDYVDQQQLNHAYREFQGEYEKCRFNECLHISEPDCAVKTLIGSSLSLGRYERYVKLKQQMIEKEKNKYG